MDWNRIEGNWKQTTGKIKEKWGKLTEDDLTQISGKREQLEGKIQECYGLAQGSGERKARDACRHAAIASSSLPCSPSALAQPG